MNDAESQRLIRDAEDYTRGHIAERTCPAGHRGPLPPLPDSAYPPGAVALPVETTLPFHVEDVPLDVIAERVIAEFLRDWDADGAGFFDHRHGARALICRLADAGAIVTPDADGSEHPGAHALRQAASSIAPRFVFRSEDVQTWLRARADQLEAGDG